LNNTTADPGVSPLLAEIARLQTELDHANESIDNKLDELQEAGLGVIDLTRNLADARSQITSLENEIARLQRREERRLRRLEKLRCQKCFMKIDPSKLQRVYEADERYGIRSFLKLILTLLASSLDISHSCLPSNPPTPPTKTSEALRLELRNVNAQLDVMKKQWQDEKRQLLGEKAVLQDAANRMNNEVRNAKDEARRATEAERASRRSRADTQGVRIRRADYCDLIIISHYNRKLRRPRVSSLISRRNYKRNACDSGRCLLNRNVFNARSERLLGNCSALKR
jgi:predicted  nucleic acid-binding Zn-ribbon protein